MAEPWRTIDTAETPDGLLELRQRGKRDFLILIAGRVLMNSSASRSEIALGEVSCARVADRASSCVLIGGLGMGITLRAALDVLPKEAKITVAEINPLIVEWCRGPLASLNLHALADPRVQVRMDDVSAVITQAGTPGKVRFDAIMLDLYEGPHAGTDALHDPFYSSRAIATTHAALNQGGVFAIWGENSDASFERRLQRAGFTVERLRPGRGGLRHVVYVAIKR